MAFSSDIITAISAMQNDPRTYWSTIKPSLRYVASAFAALGGGSTAVGTAVSAVVNGVGNEQIVNWSDLKPILVTINDRLIALNETVLGAAIEARLQAIPNDNNQVFNDQIRNILADISEALGNLGQ